MIGLGVTRRAEVPDLRIDMAVADGQIEIDKNTKYQEEKGQWTMDGSFLLYTA